MARAGHGSPKGDCVRSHLLYYVASSNSSNCSRSSNVLILGGQILVQGFFWVLFEAQGIFLGFDFFPAFHHPCHLKSGVPLPPPPSLGLIPSMIRARVIQSFAIIAIIFKFILYSFFFSLFVFI